MKLELTSKEVAEDFSANALKPGEFGVVTSASVPACSVGSVVLRTRDTVKILVVLASSWWATGQTWLDPFPEGIRVRHLRVGESIMRVE
jgi:hypothetical protein